jgi:hypothetical protein
MNADQPHSGGGRLESDPDIGSRSQAVARRDAPAKRSGAILLDWHRRTPEARRILAKPSPPAKTASRARRAMTRIGCTMSATHAESDATAMPDRPLLGRSGPRLAPRLIIGRPGVRREDCTGKSDVTRESARCHKPRLDSHPSWLHIVYGQPRGDARKCDLRQRGRCL